MTPPELEPSLSLSETDLSDSRLGLGLTLGLVIDLRLRFRCSFYRSRAMLLFKAKSN